jgi:hydroxyquinol 1,2-dioxygenase
MSNNSEEQITKNVLDSMEHAPNPRLKQVMSSLVTHIHTFMREVELTQQEWALGIQFLTRTGHMCDERRQEFILLSDITGVTMLVDAINHRLPGGATESTIFGPFYREGAAELPTGATISKDGRGASFPPLERPFPALCSTSGRLTKTGCTSNRTPGNPR